MGNSQNSKPKKTGASSIFKKILNIYLALLTGLTLLSFLIGIIIKCVFFLPIYKLLKPIHDRHPKCIYALLLLSIPGIFYYGYLLFCKIYPFAPSWAIKCWLAFKKLWLAIRKYSIAKQVFLYPLYLLVTIVPFLAVKVMAKISFIALGLYHFPGLSILTAILGSTIISTYFLYKGWDPTNSIKTALNTLHTSFQPYLSNKNFEGAPAKNFALGSQGYTMASSDQHAEEEEEEDNCASDSALPRK
jgi:hypothetical protein